MTSQIQNIILEKKAEARTKFLDKDAPEFTSEEMLSFLESSLLSVHNAAIESAMEEVKKFPTKDIDYESDEYDNGLQTMKANILFALSKLREEK